jgi:serine/threonine protein kinase
MFAQSTTSAAVERDHARLTPGEIVDGRYVVQSNLGGGGMAGVCRATHVALNQPVAIKVMSSCVRDVADVEQRFMREARAATQLKSAHVVRVFDVGTMPDGAPYMVMEYLDGKDLGELLAEGWRPSVQEAVELVLQACEALAEVHGLRIVHRDLKPANLFLTRGADGLPSIKLIDFGISRAETPLWSNDAINLTDPDVVFGTPRYMAPESMESAKAADARSDIWGIGTVLYELITGKTPYEGKSVQALYSAASASTQPTASTSQCPTGEHVCFGVCVHNDDPLYGCGDAACVPCTAGHGTPSCVAGKCAVSSCDTGSRIATKIPRTAARSTCREDVLRCLQRCMSARGSSMRSERRRV